MELRFLGQVYSTSNVQVETVPSDLTVCFRGQTYNLRRPIQTAKSQFGIRIYRGVLYGKN